LCLECKLGTKNIPRPEKNQAKQEEKKMGEFWNRFKFPALWILYIIGYIVYRTMANADDAYNVSLLSTGEFITIIVILAVIAILSAILKGRIFRSLNIIAGIIFLAIQVIMFVDGITAYPSSLFNIPTGVTVVVLAALVWFAFRLPKQTA
jgi:hypothetical protein